MKGKQKSGRGEDRTKTGQSGVASVEKTCCTSGKAVMALEKAAI